jgi:hypothetical protein
MLPGAYERRDVVEATCVHSNVGSSGGFIPARNMIVPTRA